MSKKMYWGIASLILLIGIEVTRIVIRVIRDSDKQSPKSGRQLNASKRNPNKVDRKIQKL